LTNSSRPRAAFSLEGNPMGYYLNGAWYEGEPSTNAGLGTTGNIANYQMADGTQGTQQDSLFYQSWLQGVQPQQPQSSTYDAYLRAGQYMDAFQNGPLMLNQNGAAGLTGGLLTESDFFKIYNQPGVDGVWGTQYGYNQGDPNSGIGDAQWTYPSRHDGFIDYSTNNGLNPSSFAANYGYIAQELLGPEQRHLSGLQNATDLMGGVQAGLRYENPGVPHMDWRYANALATSNNVFAQQPEVAREFARLNPGLAMGGENPGFGGFGTQATGGQGWGGYGSDQSYTDPFGVNNIIPQINSGSSFTDPGTGRSFTTGDGSGFNGVKNGVPVDMYGNPMPGYSAGGDQYAKGGNTGSLVYQTDGSYQPQGQQSYGNNEYGYGGTYDPNAYGYGGTDYSTGNPQNATTAIQNAQYMSFTDPTTGTSFATGDGSGFNGVKNGVPVDMYGNPMPGYSGQPDITVYANPQPRDQFGQAMGGDMGSTLYSATAELGGGLTMADAARQNAAFESVFSSGAQDHMFYEGQLNNLTANNGWTDTNVFQPQQINGYTYQPQIATTTWGVNNPTVNQNISNLNPSNQLSYDPWSTQYQPY
jgi:hypothetical protein